MYIIDIFNAKTIFLILMFFFYYQMSLMLYMHGATHPKWFISEIGSWKVNEYG